MLLPSVTHNLWFHGERDFLPQLVTSMLNRREMLRRRGSWKMQREMDWRRMSKEE